MEKCTITGIYRSPEGTSHRYKAGALLPDGYVLVSRGEIVELPEVVAEANADLPGGKQAPAPENKAEKPPGTKKPGSVAARLEG
jgi:hypothetical protein